MLEFCRSHHRWLRVALVGLASLAALNDSFAADVTFEMVLKDLHRPAALAVRPGGTADRYELFIAESGAGRVVRWSNHDAESTQITIEGFQSGENDRLVEQQGPLALLFVDAGLLAVGGTTVDQGIVRVFELPDKGERLSADKPREQLNGGPKAVACSALARTRVNEFVQDQLILIVGDSDGRNALHKARVQAGTVAALQPFSHQLGTGSWQALTCSPTGRIVAVSKNADGDACELVFINPIDGTIELTMPLDLPNVVALAYSPTTLNLYAADFDRGLYRIDNASQPGHAACRATRIADIPRPTALAFAPDGTLYLTTFGGQMNNGSLQVLTESL